MKALIWIFSAVTLVFFLLVTGFIIIKGAPQISWSFLTDIYKVTADKHGILPMMVNTVYLILITLLISVPVGIFAAIYLVEYAKPGKIVSVIRFTTETLAGIPSIVYGLFGLIFFVSFLKLDWSILSGALTLSIMVLPVIIRTTEESLKTVPREYKEGSLALGATRLRTIFKIILPNAISGILAAVILSIGRIVGETAALLFTSGIVPKIAQSIFNSGRTMSLHLYLLVTEGISTDEAYGTAFVLLVIVIVINRLSAYLAGRLRKRLQGGSAE
ncbi:MAG TPA: phosphate ABC transporter permease PstA [Clostridia bacterium]|nr:phosphate ABC transporter permease PstA [Clostridia bacterium]HPQ46845.1 phosphate ABC transporter permease PstA [Clostridia bacterium]HRX43164.1 phosphate ABC transporter permease PstA [Clostridia bacterium]